MTYDVDGGIDYVEHYTINKLVKAFREAGIKVDRANIEAIFEHAGIEATLKSNKADATMVLNPSEDSKISKPSASTEPDQSVLPPPEA